MYRDKKLKWVMTPEGEYKATFTTNNELMKFMRFCFICFVSSVIVILLITGVVRNTVKDITTTIPDTIVEIIETDSVVNSDLFDPASIIPKDIRNILKEYDDYGGYTKLNLYLPYNEPLYKTRGVINDSISIIKQRKGFDGRKTAVGGIFDKPDESKVSNRLVSYKE